MSKRQYFIGFLGLTILSVTLGFSVFASNDTTQPGNAVLYFSPTSGRFSPGQEFWVDVMVNSGTDYVNAVAAYFTYPPDKLKITDISREGSIMTLFSEQEPGYGTAKISGGKPTPGFSGINKIASVGFRATEDGSVSLSFASNSAVLTDKDNRNILDYSNLVDAKYSVTDDKSFIPSFVESIEGQITSTFVLPVILIAFTMVILGLFGGLALILKSKLDKMQKRLKV